MSITLTGISKAEDSVNFPVAQSLAGSDVGISERQPTSGFLSSGGSGMLLAQARIDKFPADREVFPGKLYGRPSMDARIIGFVKVGDKVKVIYREDDWYVVKLYDGRVGWLHERLLVKQVPPVASQESSPEPSVSTGRGSEKFSARLDGTDSNISMEKPEAPVDDQPLPPENPEKNQTLPGPPEAPPTALSDEISRMPEKPETKSSTSDQKSLRLIASNAALRDQPTAEKAATFAVSPNSTVTVLKEAGNWYFVEAGSGHRGWIHRQFFQDNQSKKTKQGTLSRIEAVGADTTQLDTESVKILLDSFSPPDTFVLEGEKPRIVCDFFATKPNKDLAEEIQVGGKLIKSIRLGYHKAPETKTRLVLDLYPNKDYEVDQVYYQEENLFSLVLRKK